MPDEYSSTERKFFAMAVRNLPFSISRGVWMLLGGNVASGVLGVATSSLLAIKMSSVEFGAYRMILDTATIAFPVFTLGLQYTWTRLIAVESRDRICELKAGAFVIALVVATAAASILTLTFTSISMFQNDNEKKIAAVCSFIVLVPVLKDLGAGVFSAERRFAMSALSALLPSICLVLYVSLHQNVSAARLAAVNVIVTIAMVTGLLIYGGIKFRYVIASAAKIYSQNGRVGRPIYFGSLVSLASNQYVQTVAAIGLQVSDYALLSLATMLGSAISMLAGAVAASRFAHFVKLPSIDKESDVIRRIGLPVLLFPTVVLAFIAEYRFFGKQYTSLGFVTIILSIGAVFQGNGDILNRFLFAHGRTQEMRAISTRTGFASVLIFSVLVFSFGLWGYIVSRVAVSAIYYILNRRSYIAATGCT